jgi:hypothetical protein
LRQFTIVDARFTKKARVAQKDSAAIYRARHSFARDGLEAFRSREGEAPLAPRSNNSSGKRVLASLFERSR